MKRQTRRAQVTPIVLVCLLLAGGGAISAAGQETQSSGYAIKPAEVAVPQDVPLGKFRRVIQPFENWTLICDENLQARRKVCNISQSIVDSTQTLVFSWSLAAREDGKPFMILRVPNAIGAGNSIALMFGGSGRSVNVKLDACDEKVCVGYVPVGPILRQQIGKNATAQVSYSLSPGTKVVVDAPFKGLATALSAIN